MKKMKRFKWILIIVIYFGMMGNGFAGNLDDKSNWVLASIHDELIECGTFYSIYRQLLLNTNENELAKLADPAISSLNNMAAKIGDKIGILPEAVLAKMRLQYEAQTNLMNNDANNLSILIVKYKDKCKQVTENLDSRFLFYMSEYKRKFEN